MRELGWMLPILLLLASVQGLPLDLQDRPIDPFQNHARVNVLIFVRIDCPIANRYAPEIERLRQKFASQQVAFWLVYPDSTETVAAIRQHTSEFAHHSGILRDPEHDLVKLAHARVTPEAAVFSEDRKLIYHGRIDDRYIDFGKARRTASTHELESAIEAALAGKPAVPSETRAVGCYLADLQ